MGRGSVSEVGTEAEAAEEGGAVGWDVAGFQADGE